MFAPKELFAPASATGPSGFRNRPRPYAVRASHLNGAAFAPGDTFHFDLHWFAPPVLDVIVRALTQAADAGLGPSRGRAKLLDVVTFDAEHHPAPSGQPIRLDLSPEARPVDTVTITFVTPTELKAGSEIVAEPEFPVLFARVRDRISALSSFYGPGPLAADFASLASLASDVRLTRCDLQHAAVERRSSRTGQTHSLGGFTGVAVYQGDLAPFLPWLRCAEWTGVGRHSAFGNGEIRLDKIT